MLSRGRGNGRAKQRSAVSRIRDRLIEAEATLDAIRNGEVDALVVSGPEGERTLTLEGATHPYFTLLNAMSDGAALLEPSGRILFGNKSFGRMAGVPVEALRGTMFQRLVAPGQRAAFEALERDGSPSAGTREFTLVTKRGSTIAVEISLSSLPLATYGRADQDEASAKRATAVLMAIITDLTHRNAEQRARAALLERLIAAEDDERRRIARELHDETGQSLTALLVGLRAVADMSVRPEVRGAVMRLRDVAAHTIDDVGRLARGLHPAVLDDLGLAPAARRYVRDYARAFGTHVDFTAGDLDSPRLVPLAAATMYRIIQETLTNVARHAGATVVSVALTRDVAAIDLIVRDNGIGFDVDRALGAASGLGLRGMRERVTLLGGSLEIESTAGAGTVVRARIPITRASSASAQKRKRTRAVAPGRGLKS